MNQNIPPLALINPKTLNRRSIVQAKIDDVLAVNLDLNLTEEQVWNHALAVVVSKTANDTDAPWENDRHNRELYEAVFALYLAELEALQQVFNPAE